MAAKRKKYKRLTNKEKQMNKEIKQELIDKGIIPPPKPKFNRKKFAQEVVTEYEDFSLYDNLIYIFSAISFMIPSTQYDLKKISPEQIGVLKMLKLAMEFRKFEEDVKERGDTTYKYTELFDKVVNPILDL